MTKKQKPTAAEHDLLMGNEDTRDVTEELAQAQRIEAAFDESMRELTRTQFDALVDEARAMGDAETVEQAEAWLAANGYAALTPETEPPVEKLGTPDEEYAKHIARAQQQVAEFRLSPLAQKLLAAACENVASNTGRGIEDRDQQLIVQERAALFAASDNDLSQVLGFVADNVETDVVPSTVYSICFAVQKAANFAANLMYRSALRTDEDTRAEAVMRGEAAGQSWDGAHRDAPVGCGADSDEEVAFDAEGNRVFKIAGGEPAQMAHEKVLDAFEELHVYLSVLPDAFGWRDANVMPYMFVANMNDRGDLTGNFQAVDSAMQALDIQEVRSAQSRVRRAKRQSAALGQALAGARSALLKAGRRAAAA